ncbi:MAG: RNase III inhibitor [Elusimicrobia bacterium]|nr:RNase III inhibitor [Elusimicrobiota bacterium]MBD3411681.1 RNase III inhibitor [Elusimicrobiota bacterium]
MMEKFVGPSALEIVQGDITRQDTEAIGNAANAALAGGGGVDGAIHKAGGPAIMDELKKKYIGCPTGSAVMTGGGRLSSRYVIHAVGPRYRGKPEDKGLLKNAYESSLRLCSEHRIESISLPSISTGVYGYPVEEASQIAIKTVVDYLQKHQEIKRVRFVLFDRQTYDQYSKTAKELLP